MRGFVRASGASNVGKPHEQSSRCRCRRRPPGAGYVGATAWSGQQIEARYREQLDRVPAKMPLIRIFEQKYDRGLFVSTSTATLGFGCPAEAGKPLPVVTITSTIRHGPIAGATLALAVVDSKVRIAGGDADVQQLTVALGPDAPLTVHTVASFAGPVRSTLTSPAIKLPLGKGAELDWRGLGGDVESSRDGQSVSYRVKSGGLTLTDPASHTTVRIGELAFQGEGRAITPVGALMAGQLQGTLEAIEISACAVGAQTVMAMNRLAFSTSTAIDGELLKGTSSMIAKGSFGDVKLDKIEMKMSMKRLHAPTYQHLMETTTQELYRCGAADKAASLMAMREKMQGDLVALLRHAPEMSIDRIAVDSGGMTGELSYTVGSEGVTDADAAQPLPAMLMTRAYLRGAFRVPVAWLRKLSQATAAKLPGRAPDPSTVDVMLDQAQAQSYVVRDGDYVKGEASYAKGALSVNGKPFGSQARR